MLLQAMVPAVFLDRDGTINRLVFYEGDVKYRIEPQKIIDFFGLESKSS